MKHYRQHQMPNYEMGSHYMDHVLAMTNEDLHNKSAIAEELAWRDIQIERLTKERDDARRTAEYWKANHLAGNKELDACQRDAERYRYYIESLNETFEQNPILHRLIEFNPPTKEQFDAAIDEAMKEQRT